MVKSDIESKQAWDGRLIDEPELWRFELTDEALMLLGALTEDVGIENLAGFHPKGDRLDALRVELGPLRKALKDGCGFGVLGRLPMERISRERASLMYWVLGHGLGDPMVQNIEGTLLYDVRDTGKSLEEGSRFSVTNQESSFHTDAAFTEEPPDIVGLLCLQSARLGGVSQLINIHRLLQELDDDLAPVLESDFCFERRGGVREGQEPYLKAPIVSRDGSNVQMRYIRYYIDEGHARAGVALTAEQKRAIDAIDANLENPALAVEFLMSPGEMLFANNHTTLHNRTGFEDHPELERRRHYVRLWLRAN